MVAHDGEVTQSRPVAYQIHDGERAAVAVNYVRVASDTVRLSLGDYDSTRALVIDPEIEASTYFGGSDRDRVCATCV